jgi:hypothetical protein
MRKRLKFAKDMFFLNLMSESYAFNVVQALNAHPQYLNYVGYIIGDCINFNVCFHSLSFLHITREANQSVLYLAQYSLHNLYCIWIEETSTYIHVILTIDLFTDVR